MRSLRRFFTLSLGTFAASVALYGGGCGGSGPDLSDVVYEGLATDEALLAYLDATPEVDAAHAAVVDAPTDGGTLASGAAITWHLPSGTASVAPAPRRSPRGWSAPLREVVGPERSAFAHGDPLNGLAYLVELSSGGDTVYRVFTTDPSHTPDAAHFAMLSGKAVEICVSSAIFEQNEIAPDGGPFVGGCVTATAD